MEMGMLRNLHFFDGIDTAELEAFSRAVAGAESGERADVTVGGKSVILKKGMSYAEICKLLGGEGRVALGAPIYTWSCGDGVTLTVRFELTGDADTPYPERMKAVSFAVSGG